MTASTMMYKATIGSNSTQSQSLTIHHAIIGLILPDAFTGTFINIETSDDGTNWHDLK